ncbi:MAG: cytochrome b/b6 domain-containing protein [Pseudomonadota bacterium]
MSTASTDPSAPGLTNSATAYGLVTKTVHWLTALLIVGVIATGTIAYDLSISDPVQLDWKIRLYAVHKAIGLTIFFVALFRIAWAFSQPKPGMIGAEKKVQSFMAQLVHWTLYASLVLVPLTGWMTHAATEGFAPIPWPFGQNLFFVPEDPELANTLAGVHLLFQRLLVIALVLHIAGALKHHFIDKDATLRRMWFGKPKLPRVSPTPHAALPAVTAAAIFAAVGTAAALVPVKGAVDVPALEEVASDWRVLEGQIEIEVTQLGTPVTGSFADWTAAIAFDPAADGAVKGDAEVTIAIGSLTLGSVTSQAMGADFFNLEAFPTATVAGDIVEVGEGYELQGTVRIKDTEAPLTLPFELALEGERAEATGSVTLDRMTFAIGTGTDEASLGPGVDVRIGLTATTAPAEDDGTS